MYRALAAWKAGLKRLQLAEVYESTTTEGIIVGGGLPDYGIVLWVLIADNRWARIRIPEGRDGLYGGAEFVLALKEGVERRLADLPEFAEVYKKVLRRGEEMGLLVLDEDAANWPLDMPYGC